MVRFIGPHNIIVSVFFIRVLVVHFHVCYYLSLSASVIHPSSADQNWYNIKKNKPTILLNIGWLHHIPGNKLYKFHQILIVIHNTYIRDIPED